MALLFRLIILRYFCFCEFLCTSQYDAEVALFGAHAKDPNLCRFLILSLHLRGYGMILKSQGSKSTAFVTFFIATDSVQYMKNKNDLNVSFKRPKRTNDLQCSFVVERTL